MPIITRIMIIKIRFQLLTKIMVNGRIGNMNVFDVIHECKSNLIRGVIHLELTILVVYRMAVLLLSRTDSLNHHSVTRLAINNSHL